MKIPGLDGLIVFGARAAHKMSLFQTAKTLNAVGPESVRGILIAVTTALGDSITFTPALTAIRNRFTSTRIVGLYHRAFAPLYARDPRFGRVIPYHGKYSKVFETVRALKEENCELALLPYINDPDVVPLTILGGSRILFRMPGRNTVYRAMVAHPELLSSTPPLDHANLRGADMVRHIGCDVADLDASLHVDADSRVRIDELLRRVSIPGCAQPRPLIGVHPGASIPQKRWHSDRYANAARLLLDCFDHAAILITGAESERALCESIRRDIGGSRVHNFAGDVPIQDLPALLEKFDVFISGDTGVAVMAYAMKRPTVTLFWHTNPDICGPRSPGGIHRVIRGADVKSISPDAVFQTAVDLLREHRS